MIIRKVKIDDSERIRILLQQLGHILSLEELRKRVTSYINKDIYEILVAEENEIILGLVVANFYQSFCFETGCILHIEALIVDDKERGRGIGKQLIKAIENKAIKEHNCDYSELLTLAHRKQDGTHNFYENLGYQDQDKTDITYFLKKLDSKTKRA